MSKYKSFFASDDGPKPSKHFKPDAYFPVDTAREKARKEAEDDEQNTCQHTSQRGFRYKSRYCMDCSKQLLYDYDDPQVTARERYNERFRESFAGRKPTPFVERHDGRDK